MSGENQPLDILAKRTVLVQFLEVVRHAAEHAPGPYRLVCRDVGREKFRCGTERERPNVEFQRCPSIQWTVAEQRRLLHHADRRSNEDERGTRGVERVVEQRLQHRRETFVLLDEVRELIENDDRIAIAEVPEQPFPVRTNVLDRGKLRGRHFDELFEL